MSRLRPTGLLLLACALLAAVPGAAQQPCSSNWLSRVFQSLGLPCPSSSSTIVRGSIAELNGDELHFPSGTKLRIYDVRRSQERVLSGCTECSYPTPAPSNRIYVLDVGRVVSVDARNGRATPGPAAPGVRALFAWNAEERALLALVRDGSSYAFRLLDPATGTIRAAPGLEAPIPAAELLRLSRPGQHAPSGSLSWTDARNPNFLLLRAVGADQSRELLPSDALSRFQAVWTVPDQAVVYVTRGD